MQGARMGWRAGGAPADTQDTVFSMTSCGVRCSGHKFHPARNQTGLIPAVELRPDGASMIPWAHGRCLAWDVTAPDTLAQSHVQECAANAGAAAAKAEVAKTAKYAALSATHEFVPLAFETLGAWGGQAQQFVENLGRRIAGITGDIRETAFLRQRLSIAIQRGNALSIRGTLGSTSSDAAV